MFTLLSIPIVTFSTTIPTSALGIYHPLFTIPFLQRSWLIILPYLLPSVHHPHIYLFIFILLSVPTPSPIRTHPTPFAHFLIICFHQSSASFCLKTSPSTPALPAWLHLSTIPTPKPFIWFYISSTTSDSPSPSFQNINNLPSTLRDSPAFTHISGHRSKECWYFLRKYQAW